MVYHRLNRRLRRKVPNGYKWLLRVCGLYICHPPTILELLESLEVTYTPEKHLQAIQVQIDQILRLSTSFLSVSARISSWESVRARCWVLWAGSWVNQRVSWYAGHLSWRSSLVESRIKVTEVTWHGLCDESRRVPEETWLPRSNTLRKCFNNVD